MAQPIASVEIEAYDDGTYEVSQDAPGANDNEDAEPQGRKANSLDEALAKAREMLATPAMKPAAPAAMPALGAIPPSARSKPGVLSMR